MINQITAMDNDMESNRIVLIAVLTRGSRRFGNPLLTASIPV